MIIFSGGMPYERHVLEALESKTRLYAWGEIARGEKVRGLAIGLKKRNLLVI